ncbi:hypothetical protein, partial [Mesorhizobium sp. M7A.F.Ca.CA.004.08.2.1]|uniref:hypothetical protein n=1 Tax=Mesorhizobium sp. M7A.F.Ca.CA.004.08.2.1 TaxID=2496731 RepID=UPI0019D48B03
FTQKPAHVNQLSDELGQDYFKNPFCRTNSIDVGAKPILAKRRRRLCRSPLAVRRPESAEV